MSFAFADYCVDLTLTESAKMRFVPGEVDDATFESPKNLVRDIRLYGYYGGIRMLKAVAKLFFEYCFDHGIDLPEQNFTAEYRTNIPRLVGLSGSSAICSAMLKALMKFYSVDIPLEYTPTICLEAIILKSPTVLDFRIVIWLIADFGRFVPWPKGSVLVTKKGSVSDQRRECQ